MLTIYEVTLSACVWRWSCNALQGADDVASGAGEA